MTDKSSTLKNWPRVPREVWDRMLAEIMLGKESTAKNADERRVWEMLTSNVAEIRAKGQVVQIAHDWPDLDED